MSRLNKRATLILPDQKLRRLAVYDVGSGEREVVIPEHRLGPEYESVSDLPETVEVRHAGYDYTAEFLEKDGEYFIYGFQTRY